MCSFTDFSPLLAVQLNVNTEVTFKEHNSELCDKMSVKHTQFKLKTTEINFELTNEMI